ncbi:MAG: hypothetical protein CM1200mP26_23610 [Acidimicrobiales bacterium]|nr:MAG: hypothetical protein CM1200mP26_23610 [Acidimicrobiales bacterium]
MFGDGEVLIEVGGVGYRVIVTPTTAVRLGDVGGDVFVHVTTNSGSRSDPYGFLERDERTCFEALLSAHGVGPSLALAVLGVHGPVELARLWPTTTWRPCALGFPGVGKKTATRLLVELKGSLDLALDGLPAGDGDDVIPRSALVEVQEALGGLGYTPDEVRSVLADLGGDDPAVLFARRCSASPGRRSGLGLDPVVREELRVCRSCFGPRGGGRGGWPPASKP